MIKIRADKVANVANDIPMQRVKGKDATNLLVVGWGGQFGILFGAVSRLQKEGKNIAFTNFNYINPLPKNTREIFEKFDQIVVCELNSGQFAKFLRSEFPDIEFKQYNKIEGLPFKIKDLTEEFNKLIEDK